MGPAESVADRSRRPLGTQGFRPMDADAAALSRVRPSWAVCLPAGTMSLI
ncbi:hypothetical protein [Mycobacterium sp.]|nr:hypothetical protein [Mycobacterium sp.]MBW0012185.1 hypothetical protein [Mycobacterium sp.]